MPATSPVIRPSSNPAALITNLKDLVSGGLIVVDRDAFTDKNLTRAGYKANPLDDGSLDGYRVIDIDITKQVLESDRKV